MLHNSFQVPFSRNPLRRKHCRNIGWQADELLSCSGGTRTRRGFQTLMIKTGRTHRMKRRFRRHIWRKKDSRDSDSKCPSMTIRTRGKLSKNCPPNDGNLYEFIHKSGDDCQMQIILIQIRWWCQFLFDLMMIFFWFSFYLETQFVMNALLFSCFSENYIDNISFPVLHAVKFFALFTIRQAGKMIARWLDISFVIGLLLCCVGAKYWWRLRI